MHIVTNCAVIQKETLSDTSNLRIQQQCDVSQVHNMGLMLLDLVVFSCSLILMISQPSITMRITV